MRHFLYETRVRVASRRRLTQARWSSLSADVRTGIWLRESVPGFIVHAPRSSVSETRLPAALPTASCDGGGSPRG